ncbi:MFS transporter [Bacillus sp. ISL-47]|uniref:MFS transporter n=1 Tax=Bacillus sp. ISL-47 TaxID=2819130 RepID=UPI001BED0A7A|nr:MFS transporter [Bacillus sp. ISL-47]MBT2689252.1 MFS transporter [Bacillus sp. ISL-47]MBT2708623.1 MFS transporter [Pseudomonas sp. ISL-84]
MKVITYFNEHLITIITFILMIGIMGTRPLISLLSNELNASPVEIGIIIGLFPLLPTFLAIKIGHYVDSIGYKTPIIISTLMCTLSLLIPMFFVSLEGVYISQLAAGVGQTTFVVSAQAMAGQLSSDETVREKYIMKFSIGVALGSFIGPLIGGFFGERYGYPLAIGFLGSLGIISTFLSLFLKGRERAHHNERQAKNKIIHSLELLKIPHLRKAFLVSIFVLLGKDIFTAYFPLLALELGLSISIIGIIISINAVAGIIVRWSLPYLLHKWSRSTIAFSSIVLSGICFFSLPFFQSWFILSLFSFILGIGLGIGQPLSISTTIHYLPKEKVGEGLGLRLTANRLTQMSSPILFGGIAQLTSMSWVFWIIGCILVIGGKKTRLKPGA